MPTALPSAASTFPSSLSLLVSPTHGLRCKGLLPSFQAMTPQDTWDSCKERLAWNTAATKEARGANSDTLMPLHGRQASMARPPFSWCRRPSASPGPAYITLVLLLCSLVQLRVAALQLPASSPTTSSPQRLHNDSRTLTQQAVQGGFAAPPPGGALGGWRVSVARKAHLDQPEGESRR